MGRSVSATLGLRIRYWLELPPMMPDNIRINPAFRRHPEEAEIIGRLVVGFGEIEIAFCTTAAKTLQIHGASMYDRVMRSLYTIKVTSARLDVADQLMRPSFEKEGLAAEYLNTVDMVNCCRGLRNQYAHCNWTDKPGRMLGFSLLTFRIVLLHQPGFLARANSISVILTYQYSKSRNCTFQIRWSG
jgi:hypothetical protein